MTEYVAAAQRIRKAKTEADFLRCEQMIERLYLADVFSTSQFARLDGLIVDCMIAREIL